MGSYFNPYSDQFFFPFLILFCKRLWGLLIGTIPWSDLASDELQIFVLCAVGASGAIVGTFLVLRKMTMLANALSHTILLGIVIAYLLMMVFGKLQDPHQAMDLTVLLIASLSAGILTNFLTEFINKQLKLQEDASIGFVFTTLFAAGILLVTLFTRNLHVGTELVMGNVDALQKKDLEGVLVVFIINVLLCTVLFKGFKITTFDPGLSRALGFSPLFFNYLLMILTSLTSVSAFRAVGVLMVLAFFVIPPLIARVLTDRLIPLLLIAVGIGCGASICGVALSRHILTVSMTGLSTSGIVVCILAVFFILAFFLTHARNRMVKRRMKAEG